MGGGGGGRGEGGQRGGGRVCQYKALAGGSPMSHVGFN